LYFTLAPVCIYASAPVHRVIRENSATQIRSPISQINVKIKIHDIFIWLKVISSDTSVFPALTQEFTLRFHHACAGKEGQVSSADAKLNNLRAQRNTMEKHISSICVKFKLCGSQEYAGVLQYGLETLEGHYRQLPYTHKSKIWISLIMNARAKKSELFPLRLASPHYCSSKAS